MDQIPFKTMKLARFGNVKSLNRSTGKMNSRNNGN
jgi:hypothetical protein